MSNNQPQNPRQSETRNRGARQRDTGDYNYQSEQFENDSQQRGREPWRQTHDFRREEVYGRDSDWNQSDSRGRSFEQPGFGASYGQQGGNPSYGRPQNYYGQQNYSDDAYERNRQAYQSGGFTSGNQPHPIEDQDYEGRSFGGRSYSSRREGIDPDFDPMNPQRQYAGSDYNWPWNSNQQRSDQGRGRSGAWPSQSRTSNYWQPQGSGPAWQNNPSRQSDDYFGPPNSGQTDYSFGNTQHLGAGGSYSQQNHRGRAPKGYQRSDERVREDICERLSQDAQIDASEITVTVKAGVVTLDGTIDNRQQKHRVEDIADACSGVKDVQNRLTVSRDTSSSTNKQTETGQPH